jgi:hypothetical protein
MTYLDLDRLRAVDAAEFRSRAPYPWLNERGLLTDEGHARLVATLPDVSLFDRVFGVTRSHGQQPHDRFSLDYRDDLPIAREWKDFVAELRGDAYQGFLRRMYGARDLDIGFHWHYTPNGCSVSPHCDARRKLGSHIFYLNTDEDWHPEWGGETLILDDGGRLATDSAPDFDAFDRVLEAEHMGNASLLFMRKGRSWHGVREIRAPEGKFRKVFIVVANHNGPIWRLRRRLTGKASRY